ncbi:MAG: NACHT domain-containing protein [Symploca sp. SIO2B6]|nr:NACHT domain-containing protein [Symploca sp. SIO2B6]
MVEPWAALGVSILKDLVFKEVLLKLGKEALEDYVKDFFKECIKEGVVSAQPSELKKALGEALQQFLRLVEDELEFECGLSGAEIRDEYEVRIERFIRNQEVKTLLGKAFDKDCRAIDARKLGTIWIEYYPPTMPIEFDWDRLGKNYLREVKRIIKKSQELRAVLELEIQESIERNTKEIAGIIPDFDLRKYQEGLLERYGNLNLSSLDTDGAAYNQLQLWRIFIPQNVRQVHELLPQAYELPKEYQRRLRESNQLEEEIDLEELEKYKKIYEQQPIRPVGEIIKNKDSYRYLVILGDPGSGKSTLLQYLALAWANSSLQTAISKPIPLLIELRSYIRNRDTGDCKNFLEFFHQGSGIICHLNQHQLHQQLKAGNALVMFDGLDEVFEPGKREDVITDIHRFTNDYPQVRVIVTSRVIGYKPQRLRDAQFDHFMLQDLEQQQIKDFIEKWHNLTFNDEADKVRKRERLQKAINSSKAISELAGNPLLLTMMAILNRNRELPRNRPELYNQASQVLLHQWDFEDKENLVKDSRLDPETINYEDKQAMLRQVAYHMQANDKGLAGNLISADDLEEILTGYLKSIEVFQARAVARLMIQQLRTRNFILCFLGADSYAFIHRTFLEYFCAAEFVRKFEKEKTLTEDELKTEVFGKHWQDESWHEVLRLIAGLIEPKFVGKIIEYLIEQDGEADKFLNVFLAAECLAEVRNRREIKKSAEQLLNKLKGLLRFGDEQYALDTGNYDEYELIIKIRTQAVAAVATTWKEDADTLALLKLSAQQDKDVIVRLAAVQEIARGWKQDTETLPLLKLSAQQDKDVIVRQAAVREIARGWKEDAETLPLLKLSAQQDKDWIVRQTAVREIAQGWKEHPETLPLLKLSAQQDKHLDVRQAAVKEIAQGWKQDADTLPLLKLWAQQDEDSDVRLAAVQEIAQGWKDEPWMFEFLYERATNDPFERQKDWEDNPRLTALKAIIKQYRDHTEILLLLRNRIDNDTDKQVREYAQQQYDLLVD